MRTLKLARVLFGEDIFISYSRADSTAYAASLANLLSARGFACFLDQWGSEPGKEIPARVLRILGRSSMLVVIGSRRAADSEAVGREVAAFLATKRPMVPISVDSALEQGRWFALVAGASLSIESGAQLADGKPSEHVLSRIDSSYRFTKRNTRVRRSFLAAGVILIALSGIAAWRQHAAYVAIEQSTRAQVEASQAREVAMRREREANEQTEIAKANAEEAKRQETAANENAQRALQQQQLAEKRMLRARSLELAAASRSVIDAEPDLAALLAVESFGISDTFEARQALLSALSHRHQLEAVLIGPEEARVSASGSDSGRITRVWFSADGEKIAMLDWEGAISTWSVAASPREREPIVAVRGVRQSQISADFSVMAGYRWDDQTVHVHAPSRGAQDVVFVHAYGEISEIAVDPSGRLIATGSADGIVALWNAFDGTPVGEPLTKSNLSKSEDSDIGVVFPVTMLGFTPDGRILRWRTSAGVEGAVDVATRQPTTELPKIEGGAAFSAGADVAIVKGDGSLTSGRIYQGKLEGERELLHRASISTVAISADGTLIAGGTHEGIIYLFDRRASRSPSASIRAHTGEVTSLAFSPDGSRLVSGSDDRTVMLWRTRDGSLYKTVTGAALKWRGTSFGGTARFTRDGKRLLVTSGSDSIVVVSPVRAVLDGPPIRCEGAELVGLALHPDGNTLAAGSLRHGLFFSDLATQQCKERRRTPKVVANLSLVTALAFSPDGKLLASGDTEGALAVWKVDAELRGEYLRRPSSPSNDSNRINSITWMHNGKGLAVGSISNDRLWRVDGAKSAVELDGSAQHSRQTALSGDGRLLAGSVREGVNIWDVASGHVVAFFSIDKHEEHLDDDTVTALAFERTGRLVAVGQVSGRLSLFDVTEERWLADLPLPDGCLSNECAVLSLDFSSDGARLAALVNESILVWRLEPEVWLRGACDLANRDFTEVERRRYLHGEKAGRAAGCGAKAAARSQREARAAVEGRGR